MGGCALTPGGVARDMARAGPPAAVESTLRALNENENQRMLVELLRSPETRDAVEALTRAITRSLAAGIRRDLGPALAATVRDSVRAGRDDALLRFTNELTRGAAESASRGLAEGIRRDLTPAIRAALTEEQNAAAVRAAARSIGREVVLGSDDAMAIIQQRAQQRGGRPSLLSRLSSISESGAQVMKMVTVIAITLCALLGVWVARLIRKTRRIERGRLSAA